MMAVKPDLRVLVAPRGSLGRALFVLFVFLAPPASASCPAYRSGVDTTHANAQVFAYESRGYGQVFEANDTLIRAISVWRPAQPDSDGIPRRLFITEVDTSGRPSPLEHVLDGPSIMNQVGDGIHPVEYRYQFEPPLRLPHRGKFFFDIIVADCFGIMQFLADTTNSYPPGQAWFTFGSLDCSGPTRTSVSDANVDLIFQVEFCSATTPTKPQTWGRVKARYR